MNLFITNPQNPEVLSYSFILWSNNVNWKSCIFIDKSTSILKDPQASLKDFNLGCLPCIACAICMVRRISGSSIPFVKQTNGISDLLGKVAFIFNIELNSWKGIIQTIKWDSQSLTNITHVNFLVRSQWQYQWISPRWWCNRDTDNNQKTVNGKTYTNAFPLNGLTTWF